MGHPDVATEWAQPPSGAPYLTDAHNAADCFSPCDIIMNILQTMSTLLATDVHTGYISAWMESSMHGHKLARSSVSRFQLVLHACQDSSTIPYQSHNPGVDGCDDVVVV